MVFINYFLKKIYLSFIQTEATGNPRKLSLVLMVKVSQIALIIY